MTERLPIPPGEIPGPAAWRAADLAPGQWLTRLTEAEIAEIEAAARATADMELAALTAALIVLGLAVVIVFLVARVG